MSRSDQRRLAFGLATIAVIAAVGVVLTILDEALKTGDEPDGYRNGFSGLAAAEDGSHIAVHDTLAHENGPRITRVHPDGTMQAIRLHDWPGGVANDLESVCSLPDRPRQFLVAESGYWQGNFGRLIHIEIDMESNSATVLGGVQMPMLVDNSPGRVGDQIEGLECYKHGSDVTVLFGERGGSGAYGSGVVRWARLDLDPYSLAFSDTGAQGINVSAPGNWSSTTEKRDISALHLDNDGALWAAAAEDQGDLGPFYSVIYQVGRMEAGRLMVDDHLDDWREVAGFKVEALGESLLGTEDEDLGGVVRRYGH